MDVTKEITKEIFEQYGSVIIAAVAISAMLRYYAFEKEAWFNKTIRDKINEIEKNLLLIQAEKVSFEDKVDNVKITGHK